MSFYSNVILMFGTYLFQKIQNKPKRNLFQLIQFVTTTCVTRSLHTLLKCNIKYKNPNWILKWKKGAELTWFHGKKVAFFVPKLFTVWKNEKYTVTQKKFRQINSLVFSLVKTLLSRNFCQKSVTVNFRNFHTVCQSLKFSVKAM